MIQITPCLFGDIVFFIYLGLNTYAELKFLYFVVVTINCTLKNYSPLQHSINITLGECHSQ